MKIAVVHDWLVTYAGAERVLEQILQLYPDADLFSLVDFLPSGKRDFILNKQVHTSFIQRLPFAQKKYRSYLPLMPRAIESLAVTDYDIIISSSHAVAKGVNTVGGQLHICYCYTPMRYAWDLSDQYMKVAGLNRGIKKLAVKALFGYIRKWDVGTARNVDHFITLSKYIAERISRVYGRDSTVIYPPVDTDLFTPGGKKEDFYLTASRMVPYKRIDLIAESFSLMPDRRLVIIGDGPEFEKVRSKSGVNVELLGYQPAEVMRDYMQRAKAFIFAAEEDFGIAPIEAQACGTPVIAFGKGGARETVLKDKTGIFFMEQTAGSLKKAVEEFEAKEGMFDPAVIRANAERFGKDRFKREMKQFVDAKITEFFARSGITKSS